MKVSVTEGRKEDIPDADAYALVDILRSTSTIPIILKNGAREIIPIFRLSTARAMKKKNPEYIAIGERYGFKIPQFDYGNSPNDVQDANFDGKTILFTSTNCTRVLEKLRDKPNVFISSFVNFSATLQKISKFENIGIVMSGRPDGSADEDQIFALFLEETLKGKDVDADAFIKMTKRSNGARRLKMIGYGRDIAPATAIDSVKFPVVYEDGKIFRMK